MKSGKVCSVLSEQNNEEFTISEKMYLFLAKYREFTWLAGILMGIMAVLVLMLSVFDFEQSYKDVFIYISFGIIALYSLLRLKKRTDLRKVLDDYIRQNYFFTFQTIKPEGTDSLEKFMSLAINVFPSIKQEIKKLEKKRLKWQDEHDDLNSDYKFDISLNTSDGIFLVKYFQDSVKFEDVEKIVDIANKFYRKKHVLRFVCLAKKYDDIFFTDELNEKMNKLLPPTKEFKTLLSKGVAHKWIKLDLIVERENGYTMIWVD